MMKKKQKTTDFEQKRAQTQCATCGKFHPGKCWFKKKEGKTNNQVKPTKTNNQRTLIIIDGCSTRCW